MLQTAMKRNDKLNFLFNKDLCAIDVDRITLDVHNFDNIDESIATHDNIWSLMVLMSLITNNSGAQIFYRTDVCQIHAEEYSGKSVMDAARGCVRVISGKPEHKTVDEIIKCG